jgi:hypothetical protein
MTAEARVARDPVPRAVPGQRTYWIQPAIIATAFTLFIAYGIWSVIIAAGGRVWEHGPYLSPFYSPLIKLSWFPLSSALLVAWAPLGFRATCYYYRKAYYRAFFFDPPACAIREPSYREGHTYRGERGFPWILNNFHRFFLYPALVVLAVLWFDVLQAFHYQNGIYVGVGSIIMLANVVLLTGYTFSCHALRHLAGGNIDCFSCVMFGKQRYKGYRFLSKLNPYHPAFAWFSLVSVVVVDAYIRITSVMGNCFGPHTGC